MEMPFYGISIQKVLAGGLGAVLSRRAPINNPSSFSIDCERHDGSAGVGYGLLDPASLFGRRDGDHASSTACAADLACKRSFIHGRHHNLGDLVGAYSGCQGSRGFAIPGR